MVVNVQIGKTGITENFIDNLKKASMQHSQIRISVLRSFSRDKAKIKEVAEEICKQIETDRFRFKAKVLGFTILILRFKNRKK